MAYFNVKPLLGLPLVDLYLEIIGVGFLLYYAIFLGSKALINLYAFFCSFGHIDLKSYGKWAVITGCTDGIGKAYAEQFAKVGINVVLISRSLEKLNAQAKELEATYNIATLVISADFTEPDSIYSEIRKHINGLDVGILVNNVGICYRYSRNLTLYFDKEQVCLIRYQVNLEMQMRGIWFKSKVYENQSIIDFLIDLIS